MALCVINRIIMRIFYFLVVASILLTFMSCKKKDEENSYKYYFTEGRLEKNGDIKIEIGANLYDRGYHESISGYKIN